MPEKLSENMSEEIVTRYATEIVRKYVRRNVGKKGLKDGGTICPGRCHDIYIYIHDMSRYVAISIIEFTKYVSESLSEYMQASMYIISRYKSHVRTCQKICPNSGKSVMLHGAKKYGGCSIYMFLSGAGSLNFP